MMNKALGIIIRAQNKGVKLEIEDDTLVLKSENENIDNDLIADIKYNKELIIECLSKMDVVNVPYERFNKDEIKPFDRGSVKRIPLSFNQERLWFLDQLQGSVEYHIPFTLKLSGNLDKKILSSSLKEIVTRHEVLRTVIYSEEGVGYQKVLSPDDWELSFKDITTDSSVLMEDLKSFLSIPFDLSSDYTFRSCLYELGDKEYVLAGVFHHIASDGWSQKILIGDFIDIYHAYVLGKEKSLPSLSLQYSDYALWQRKHLDDAIVDNQLSYWEQQLEGVSTLQLPKDYVRPVVRNISGANFYFELDGSLGVGINSLSRKEGVTVFMTLLAAFKVLLSRYSGQEDICVGTSVANRTQKELEGMIGFFVNNLALRTQVTEYSSFRQLLQAVKQTTVDAYDHQQAPLEKIVNRVVAARDMRMNPLFQVLFVLQNIRKDKNIDIKGLTISNYEDQGLTTSNFDLKMTIEERETGFSVNINYCTDLFKEKTIQRMSAHYQELLKAIVVSPTSQIGDLSMLTEQERHQVLEVFNDITVDYPREGTVVDLFEAQASKTPEGIAVVYDGKHLTYKDLDEKSNQLARYLVDKGVSSDTLVGICMGRSLEMIIGILGILKSGGAYVPIDPDFPQSRIDYMLEDSGVGILLSDSKNSDVFSDKDNIDVVLLDRDWDTIDTVFKDKIKRVASPDNRVYVIYTSGSTGRPKGVQIAHRSLMDYFHGLLDKTNISSCRSFGLTSSIATDLGNTVLYPSFLTGGTLYVLSEDELMDADSISALNIDCLKMVPSHWKTLRSKDTVLAPNKCLILGGEAFTDDVFDLLATNDVGCEVYNHYGPTETTIGKLIHKVDLTEELSRSVPLGVPFGNTDVYVLDLKDRLCPIGVVGELCIGGDGLAVGYLNNEELTNERFVTNPFRAGGRIYRTGDLARWLADGTIEFLGRKDNQVKIRGYRIELGEIENVLSRLPGVVQSCVLAKADEHGDKRLVAYVVMDGALDKEALQTQLQESLPEYMIPQLWVQLDEMPLTSNGKLDRKALPDPDSSDLSTKAYVAPRTELEERLVEIWQELLGIEKVGVYDNFFELGGQSLLAIRLIARIRKLGYTVNIGDFYADPTIALLSAKLTSIDEGYKVPENGIVEGCQYITPSMVSLVDLSQEELDSIMDHVPGGAINIQDIYPLAPLQEGIYFHHLMSDTTKGDPYVLSQLLSFPSLDKRSKFIDALSFVINRHDVLRTCVLSDGLSKTVQVVLREVSLNVEELAIDEVHNILPQGEQKQTSNNLYIDLAQAPTVRVKVADDVTKGTYYLVLDHHHMMMDHIGTSKIIEEIGRYLSGQGGLLSTPALYRDFIGYTLNKEKLEESKNYFIDLYSTIEASSYPFNLLDTKIDGSTAIVSSQTMLTPELRDSIRKISNDLQMSPAVLFHAAFGLVVGRCSGTDYALFGSVLLGRLQGAKGSESSLGLFMNSLPLLLDLKGDISSYIAQTNESLQSLLDHEQTSLSSVHDWSGIPNDVPVFSALLNYRHSSSGSLDRIPGFDGELLSGYYRTNYPFSLDVDDCGNDFGLTFNIASIGIDPSTLVSYMEEALKALLTHMDTPSQMTVEGLSILTKEETHQLLAVFNDTDTTYAADTTVVDLFEAQAVKTPDSIAVVYEGDHLTYRELDEKSNQLAHYLIDKGVSVADMVGICLDRNINMIVGILGILKSGAAYVPIDPDYPQSRKNYMLEDSECKILITDSSNTLSVQDNVDVVLFDKDWDAIGKASKDKIKRIASPDNPVYILYTSGSTGNPKGVLMPHKGMFNLISAYYGMEITSERVAQFNSMSFDASFSEVFFTLTTGGSLYMLPSPLKGDLSGFAAFVNDNAIKAMWLPTSFFHFIGGENVLEKLTPLEDIIVAGEQLQLSKAVIKGLSAIDVTLHNHYGPTEAHVVTTKKVDYRLETISDELADIGKPVPNTQIYILNKHLDLVPTGSVGELCIGGDQVARGYLNKESLTHEKFVVNPFRAGERMYKTGDLARWLPDGNIEFLGRKDDQVKIRGYRIELGEIENLLSQLSGVIQSCVLVKQDSEGNNRLVGYVVMETAFDKETLQSQLEENLPEYMVPRLWVELGEMPLTSNGKLDRRALPEPDSSELSSKAYAAPRTALEEQLVVIWQELLSIEKVGIYDNFFELGGHSLLATRLVSVIRKELDVEITIRDVFAHTTIDSLGAYLSTQEKGTLLPKVIKAHKRPDKVPLSFSQERLWFLDRLQGSLEYHIPFALRLSGNLDKKALSSSLKEIVTRHEVLRTVIRSEEGVGYQEVLPPDRWELSYKDMTTNTSLLREDLKSFLSTAFDLGSDYMFRSCLYDLGDKEYVLAGVFHHISSDGWSLGILISEFVALYRSYVSGKEIDLPLLPLQYMDYALWQREHLEGTIIEDQLSYWEDQLEGVNTLQLPTDYTRPSVQSISGASLSFELDSVLSSGINSLSQQEGVTVFMTLLTAFKVLLGRYSGQEDICVGTPVANRTQKELEDMIGFFVNTLALRTQVKGDVSFRALLQGVKQTTLDAYDHQQVSFEKVVERIVKTRDMSVTPLFQVMFVLQNTPDNMAIEMDGLSLHNYEAQEQETSKFDITMTLEETDTGFSVDINYCTELFREETIQRMFVHYQELLQSIVASPTSQIVDLSMLTGEEKHQLLEVFNDTTVDYPRDKTVVDLFEVQALKTPDAMAVVYEGERLTYRELDEKLNQLAHYLIDNGVLLEDLVGICIDRSLEMIIGILGIMKSGGAYVPIDPTYPEDRINFMLSDSRAKIVLSSSDCAATLSDKDNLDVVLLDSDWDTISRESKDKIRRVASPSNLAYVIYTSGSTGRPKGVMNSHKGILNGLLWAQDTYGLTSEDVVLQKTSFSFDVSIWELIWPLMSGSKLVFARPGAQGDVAYLIDLIETEQVTTIHFVPSMLEVFLAGISIGDCSSLCRVLCSGEALTLEQVRSFRELFPKIQFDNLYGPTEAAVHVSSWSVPEDIGSLEKIPIGSPVANTSLYVMDSNKSLLPKGVVGELCIGGAGVAVGYLNRESLTNEKFVSDPFREGGRMYRTGDLARWLPDGTIEFLGRKDYQVKIRGYRIELGEIENVLSGLSGVTQSCVLAKEDSNGNSRLIGYVVMETDLDKEALQTQLEESLPEYMVPRIWVQLEEMPLTTSGKLDRKALPEPDGSDLSIKAYVAPRTEMEEQLVAIWQELLGIEKVGIHDNFFELGGHSLLAFKIVTQINKVFDTDMRIALLFEYPTIYQLAANINAKSLFDNHILIPFREPGNQRPLFLLPDGSGTCHVYGGLTKSLGSDQPIYGFHSPGLDGDSEVPESLEEMISLFISELQKVDPNGPYRLGGYSFGVKIAYQMALQLERQGFEVEELLFFDGKPESEITGDNEENGKAFRGLIKILIDFHKENLDWSGFDVDGETFDWDDLFIDSESVDEQINHVCKKLRPINEREFRGRLKVRFNNYKFIRSYRPVIDEKLDTKITLFRAIYEREEVNGEKIIKEDVHDYEWSQYTNQEVVVHQIPANHHNILVTKNNVKRITELLKE